MEDKNTVFEPLIERLEALGKTSIEIAKLKAIDKTTKFASNLSSRILALVLLSMALIFANIAAALWLGSLLGAYYIGFLILAGFYTVVGIVVYFILHKWIKTQVSDAIITQFLN